MLKCDNKRWSAIDERMERSKTNEWNAPNKNKVTDKAYSVLDAARSAEPEPKLDWGNSPVRNKVDSSKLSRRNSDTFLSQLAPKLWSVQNWTVRGRAKTKIGLSSVLNQEWCGNNIRTHLR